LSDPLSLLSSESHIIIEIKAKISEPEKIRRVLKSQNAEFKGIDKQTDTYFNVKQGRLKLREGNIENHLIYYERENQSGPKQSEVLLYKTEPGLAIKDILSKSLGVLVTVKKEREIYFINNVKFHIDSVNNLGSFAEIEAIGNPGISKREELLKQCKFYMNLFEIREENLIENSYSDMLLNK
jgi:adenylate cyclase, class 2